jgi:hypothetical protein
LQQHLDVVQRGHQWRVQKHFLDTVAAPLNRSIGFFTSTEQFGSGELQMSSARRSVKEMKRALVLSHRSNMVMQKQIKCFDHNKVLSEKKIREHIQQQKRQYVKDASAPPISTVRKTQAPYAFVSRSSVSKEIDEVFTRLLASSGRDAYNLFDTLSPEETDGVFDLLADEILRQREREVVWLRLQGVIRQAWIQTPKARIETLLRAAPGTYVRVWIVDKERHVLWSKKSKWGSGEEPFKLRKLDHEQSQLARTFRKQRFAVQRYEGKEQWERLDLPEVWRKELLFADDHGGSVEVITNPVFADSDSVVAIVECVCEDRISFVDLQVVAQLSPMIYAAVMMLKQMQDEEANFRRQHYLLDVQTGSIPLGISQARGILQVVMCITAWFRHVFLAENVSIAVHNLDESVDVYGLTEAGYLDRRKNIDECYLKVYGPNPPDIIWHPIVYEQRPEPGYGSLVAEVLAHGRSVTTRGLASGTHRPEVDCVVDTAAPPSRVRHFSLPLLRRGAVRRVDAVLQFWCLDPECANGDSGIYDPSKPSHQAVLAKLLEWAQDLVSTNWALKENAFEVLLKGALDRSKSEKLGSRGRSRGKAGTPTQARRGKKTTRPAEQHGWGRGVVSTRTPNRRGA